MEEESGTRRKEREEEARIVERQRERTERRGG